MNYLKFALGWFGWHLKAGFWYLGLAFRLFFSIGFDSNPNVGSSEDNDVSQLFKYQGARSYRKHLSNR